MSIPFLPIHAPAPASQLFSKCPGIYRIVSAKDGGVCRIRLELGELSFHQMNTIANVAKQYGNGVIELTTRANIQIRGIIKKNHKRLIETLISAKLGPIQKAGDNIRNVMINPTAGFDQHGSPCVLSLAKNLLRRLQSTSKSLTLSPKFSFYIDGGEQCAVTNHVHDMWFYVTRNEKYFIFGLASCPPLERNSTIPPLAMIKHEQVFKAINVLLDCLHKARQDNPTVQRMKHLYMFWGHERIFNFLKQKIPDAMSVPIFWSRPVPSSRLDLGIHPTRFFERYYLGIKPPLGRLSWRLMKNIIKVAKKTISTSLLRLTPWQGIIFPDCSLLKAKRLLNNFEKMMMVCNFNNPYAGILCCTGLKGCHNALSDVQADARKLTETVKDQRVFQQVIHLPACSKSCTATRMYPITLLAIKNGFYDIYHAKEKGENELFGSRIAKDIAVDKIASFLSNFLEETKNFRKI